MVRRQAASNLAKLVKEMPAPVVIDEMIPLFQHLVQDDQDSVRLLTVEILISIAEVVPKEQQSSHGVLLTLLRNLIEDKSWRVRYMIVDRFEKVACPECTFRDDMLTLCLPDRLQRPSMTRSSRETWYPRLSSCSRITRPRSGLPLPVRSLASALSSTVPLSSTTSWAASRTSCRTARNTSAPLSARRSAAWPPSSASKSTHRPSSRRLRDAELMHAVVGLLITCCPCFFRCSRTSFRRSGSTSSPSLSW